jgi:hypothetical protein
LLVVVAIGIWLWNAPGAPKERELVFRLQGPDRALVRTFEVQLHDQQGEVLERSERFFASAPPGEVRMTTRLPPERLELWLFARDARGRELPIPRRELEITEREAYLVPVSIHAPPAIREAAPKVPADAPSDSG